MNLRLALLVPLLSLPLAAENRNSHLLTRWAADVTADNAWQAYPRPLLQREEWMNLNGTWDYAVTADSATTPPAEWAGEILVPFALEAPLSGVGRELQPDEALWYRRSLAGPVEGKRTLLHFEAVDHRTTVFVNGREVGTHTGGNTPFSFDITDALEADDNRLIVRVEDDTEGYQLRGKQSLDPGGIFYTRVSGIWQTVWIEHVAPLHLADLDFASDIESGTLTVTPRLEGPGADQATVRLAIRDNGQPVGSASGSGPLEVRIEEPKLWSPDSPHLYDVKVEVFDAAGRSTDAARSYAALRTFGTVRDAGGHLRFTLNGEPIFHWGPLDQGWWPDGLLTPPSDEAMLSDIEFLKEAGFNMIRKHIKVEPRRYYTHCDRLGMLVWQDHVSAHGRKTKEHHTPGDVSPPWTRLKPDPVDAEWPDAEHRQSVTEYRRMVDLLRDHPCVAVWVPFNEAWGQHRTLEFGKMASALDPSRPINIASGGNFWPVGDIADHHAYPEPKFPLEDDRFKDLVKVVGEFGGHGWPVEGHSWKSDKKTFSYGDLPKSIDEWKQRYARSIDNLVELRRQGIAAGVYTQTTDVEVEINGLLTYDRLPKVDTHWLRKQSEKLLQAE